MQFSETVIAAMIGAIATVSTALFQLFTVLRSRNKLEVRPKKGFAFRSIVAVIALMVASGVGGYLYSELRQQHAGEDIRSMRDELNAKLQLLASTTEKLAQAREPAQPQTMLANAALVQTDRADSVVFAPGCAAGAACTEANAQKFMLCGAIPNGAQVRKVELFAKSAESKATWDQALANFDQDVGGAKFTGGVVEHPQDESRKAICVDFVHWSADAHVARMIVHYGAASTSEFPPVQREPTAVATVAAPAAQSAAIVAPSIAQ